MYTRPICTWWSILGTSWTKYCIHTYWYIYIYILLLHIIYIYVTIYICNYIYIFIHIVLIWLTICDALSIQHRCLRQSNPGSPRCLILFSFRTLPRVLARSDLYFSGWTWSLDWLCCEHLNRKTSTDFPMKKNHGVEPVIFSRKAIKWSFMCHFNGVDADCRLSCFWFTTRRWSNKDTKWQLL